MAIIENLKERVKVDDFAEPGAFKRWMTGAIVAAALFCVAGLLLIFTLDGCRDGGSAPAGDTEAATNAVAVVGAPDLFTPVRPAPASFPPDSNLPPGKEAKTSGAIDLKSFDPVRDLVRFDDPRVWFESDHDTDDTEDDHQVYWAAEIPLKRLVNLVEKNGGKLQVQEAYRPASPERKIHLENSLHREGRAIDLTSENMSLSELAKLAWQAGFDYVLYEVPARGGPHLHCSVKRQPRKK